MAVRKIAIIGALAETPRIQGAGSSQVNGSKKVSPKDAFSNEFEHVDFTPGYSFENEDSEALVAAAVKAADQADVTLLFLGFGEGVESEGFDKSTIQLPENQQHLLDTLADGQRKVILILQGGSAIEFTSDGNPCGYHELVVRPGHE